MLLLVSVVSLVHSSPMKFEEEEEPEESPPLYEINPHFGFRKYFEIRYEPLTVPLEYAEQQVPQSQSQQVRCFWNCELCEWC